jgi:hypothetical protein
MSNNQIEAAVLLAVLDTLTVGTQLLLGNYLTGELTQEEVLAQWAQVRDANLAGEALWTNSLKKD